MVPLWTVPIALVMVRKSPQNTVLLCIIYPPHVLVCYIWFPHLTYLSVMYDFLTSYLQLDSVRETVSSASLQRRFLLVFSVWQSCSRKLACLMACSRYGRPDISSNKTPEHTTITWRYVWCDVYMCLFVFQSNHLPSIYMLVMFVCIIILCLYDGRRSFLCCVQ